MTEKDTSLLRAGLTEFLENWWECDAHLCGIELPTIGDDTIYLMAKAAVVVLEASADMSRYLATDLGAAPELS